MAPTVAIDVAELIALEPKLGARLSARRLGQERLGEMGQLLDGGVLCPVRVDISDAELDTFSIACRISLRNFASSVGRPWLQTDHLWPRNMHASQVDHNPSRASISAIPR